MDQNDNSNNNITSQTQNDQNLNNSQPQLSEKELKKQETHEASQKTAHVAGKGLANYYGGAIGNKLYDAASKTKLGKGIESTVGKVAETSPMAKPIFRALNKSGALDVADKAIDAAGASSRGKTSTNVIDQSRNLNNSKLNNSMLKGSQARTSASLNNTKGINSINKAHNLVNPPEQAGSNFDDIIKDETIPDELKQELIDERIREQEQLKQEEKKEEDRKKKNEITKGVIKFLIQNPAAMVVLLIACCLALGIIIIIYFMVSDMDLVGTQMTKYSQAESISGYCNQIILIKEHDSYTGEAVSSIDDVDLEETFKLGNQNVNRWESQTYDLEKYVKGLLQAEAIDVNEEKTFEVASIAARTYALQITSSKCYTWDNSNKNTSYRNPQNFTTDTPNSNIEKAVAATSGLVITLDNSLLNMDNGNYYDYFCHIGKDDEEDEEHSYYKMLQKNEEERLIIPIKWVKDNVPTTDYNRSGKYDGQCQQEGMSLYGAKYLLNQESDSYTTIRTIKYYYGYDVELKKVGNAFAYNGGCYYWPLSTPGTITSQFGYRNSPTAGASSNHKGIDIGVSEGTQVLATASGTVTKAGVSSGYGYAVFIDHGNGLSSEYGHLKAGGIQVNVGDTVSQGQVIALSGNTGVSTGPHLHFQIELNGTAVNPLNYVNQANPTPNCQNLLTPSGNYTGGSKADFIAFIAPFAVNDMHASNILASITIAQAALESAWGTSSLARNYNNYFGVKASGGWSGSSVNMGTTECEGARCYATSANWRVYSSPQESITDHSRVLSASRYNGVIGEKNYKTAIQIIKNGGYATDPNYVSKIISVIETNDLYQYDSM